MVDAYAESSLIHKLKKQQKLHKPLRIAFLDIDATMTGSQQTTNITRKKLEQQGFAIVYVTARTEEMIMSSTAYQLAKKRGFERQEPHLGISHGRHVYIPPENFEPEGILNPDVIAGSTGTQILVKQNDNSYLNDINYEQKFGETPVSWRQRTYDVIHEFNKEKKRAFPALFENPTKYTEGITNISTPKYRIVLTFQSNDQKIAFRRFIKEKQGGQKTPPNIYITDDSNPSKGLFVLCLTPKQGYKTKAVDHIIDMVCQHIAIKKQDLHVLIAGDSFGDVDMGLRAAKDTDVTFLLVGGSRLSHALTCLKKHEELFDSDFCAMKICLDARLRKGFYRFKSVLDPRRRVIVGDEAYLGQIGVESILAFLPKL